MATSKHLCARSYSKIRCLEIKLSSIQKMSLETKATWRSNKEVMHAYQESEIRLDTNYFTIFIALYRSQINSKIMRNRLASFEMSESLIVP